MKERYDLKVETEPSVEPITISDFTDTDYLLGVQATDTTSVKLITDYLIPAARQDVEENLNRALITTTFKMILDTQLSHIDFPKGRLQSVTSVKTIADDGTSTTESSGDYTLHTGDHGCIFLKQGKTWTATDRSEKLMEIIFIAGYGDAGSNVPVAIRMAIMRLVANRFENREFQIDEDFFSDIYRYKLE